MSSYRRSPSPLNNFTRNLSLAESPPPNEYANVSRRNATPFPARNDAGDDSDEDEEGESDKEGESDEGDSDEEESDEEGDSDEEESDDQEELKPPKKLKPSKKLKPPEKTETPKKTETPEETENQRLLQIFYNSEVYRNFIYPPYSRSPSEIIESLPFNDIQQSEEPSPWRSQIPTTPQAPLSPGHSPWPTSIPETPKIAQERRLQNASLSPLAVPYKFSNRFSPEFPLEVEVIRETPKRVREERKRNAATALAEKQEEARLKQEAKRLKKEEDEKWEKNFYGEKLLAMFKRLAENGGVNYERT